MSRPVPGFIRRELRILRDATSAYAAVLRDFDQWAEQSADVNRVIRPDVADRLDALRGEIAATLKPRRVGTVAGIVRAVGELLDSV